MKQTLLWMLLCFVVLAILLRFLWWLLKPLYNLVVWLTKKKHKSIGRQMHEWVEKDKAENAIKP